MKRQAQSLLIVGALLMAGYAPLVAHAMDPAAQVLGVEPDSCGSRYEG